MQTPDDETAADPAARATTPAAYAEAAAPVAHVKPAESEAPAAHAKPLAVALAAPDAEPAALACLCKGCHDKFLAMPLEERRALLSRLTREKGRRRRRLSRPWQCPVGGAYGQWAMEYRKTDQYKVMTEKLKEKVPKESGGKLLCQIHKSMKELFDLLPPSDRKKWQDQWLVKMGTAKGAMSAENGQARGTRKNPAFGQPVGGAYGLWSMDFKKGDQYKELHKNTKGRPLIIELARIWRELPEDKKKPYKEQYKQQSQEVASAKGKRPRGDPVDPPEHGDSQPRAARPRVLSTSGAGAPDADRTPRRGKKARSDQSAMKARKAPTLAAASSAEKGAPSKAHAAGPKRGSQRLSGNSLLDQQADAFLNRICTRSASSGPQPPPAGPAAHAGGARQPSRPTPTLADLWESTVDSSRASMGS